MVLLIYLLCRDSNPLLVLYPINTAHNAVYFSTLHLFLFWNKPAMSYFAVLFKEVFLCLCTTLVLVRLECDERTQSQFSVV